MHRYVQSKRRVELSGKLERIKALLEGFHEEILLRGEDQPWDIRAILSYVHNHLFESHLNAAGVRRACNLRNNNVSNRFRLIVGLGLKEYIEACRLEAAEQLLYEFDLEVYLVALSIGYDHQETFFRAFQRRAGCTPSEWRLGVQSKSLTASAERSRGFTSTSSGWEASEVGENAKKERHQSMSISPPLNDAY